MLVANYTSRRILVDYSSLADILFCDAFTIMEIAPGQTMPIPPKELSGDAVQPVGVIMLIGSTRVGPCIAATMTDFLMVKAHSLGTQP